MMNAKSLKQGILQCSQVQKVSVYHKKSLKLFDKVVVAVSDSEKKNYLFNPFERIDIVRKALFYDLKLNKKKSYIIDIGSNDGVALKPFLDLGFKKVLGIEPAKNLAKLANKNKIKTFNGFLEKKNIKKIKKNADLILASNVFAHSDKLREMAECMINLLSKKGTIIIEVQYLMNTLKDLTFDNIYHEHYNYWSVLSLSNFFPTQLFGIFTALAMLVAFISSLSLLPNLFSSSFH